MTLQTTSPFMQSTDLPTIRKIYEQIFEEPLTDDYINAQASKGGELECFVLGLPSREPLGFVVTQARGDAYHFWLGGILPTRRGGGHGRTMLRQIEQLATRRGFKYVTMSTYNERQQMLALAIKNGYRIENTVQDESRGQIKIQLRKSVIAKKEMRLQVIGECNFNCMFCHGEGTYDNESGACDPERAVALLEESAKLGYTDITMTGGEPVLARETIAAILDWASGRSEIERPELTLVTNASSMPDDLVEKLTSYPGKLKVHVSLHSASPGTFARITQMPEKYFDIVCQNIRKLVVAGLPVKLNQVMLSGLNVGRDDLTKYLELAKELGVVAVKLLEVLVMPENEGLYKYFFDMDAALKTLESMGIQEKRLNARGVDLRMASGFPGLVELRKCTCKIGCGDCLSIRDRTFDAKCSLRPCFALDSAIDCREVFALADRLLEGDAVISGMADRFGHRNSPILVKQAQYVNQRKLLFCVSRFSVAECKRLLQQRGFHMQERRYFHANYYHPATPSQAWLNCEKTLTTHTDRSCPDRVRIIVSESDFEADSDIGGLVERQSFSSARGGVSVGDMETTETLLCDMDFELWLESDLDIYIFTNQQHKLSLCQIGNWTMFQLEGENIELLGLLTETFDAEPLNKPHLLWMQEVLYSERGTRPQQHSA